MATEMTNDSKTSSSLSLLQNTDNVRNICIMAHVDHGKTTLADSLIASNGIISPRLAGKLKYMDSRKDEQERGITMKSSSISLYHRRQVGEENREYLINLIDSPGHVDFSLEVSTAVRLCDGALILVDVVEGVCAQTQIVLKQAWTEKIKPILVLNKLDRLITEMKMSPLDAYVQLSQIVEQVNSVMGDLFRKEVIEKNETETAKRNNTEDVDHNRDHDDHHDHVQNNKMFSDWSTGLEEADDSNVYFSPHQGNVIFASAADGWGFTIDCFARMLSTKLGFSENVLRKTLWGNYYVNGKTKRVMKGAQENVKKPLFVQLILENIWLMYDTITQKKDKEKTISMARSLLQDDSKSIQYLQHLRFTDTHSVLRTIFGRWLPLSSVILDTICAKLPPPNKLSEEKIDHLICGNAKKFATSTTHCAAETLALKSWFQKCCSTDGNAPIIVFVSKMFPVPRKHLPENRVKPLTMEQINARREEARQKFAAKAKTTAVVAGVGAAVTDDQNNQQDQEMKNSAVVADKMTDAKSNATTTSDEDEVFIAFARIYSGTIRRGSRVYVLGPKHDPYEALQRIKCGSGYRTIDDDDKGGESLSLKDLNADEHITRVTIDRLYLLMGRELESLDAVPAGNVFGIGGLDDHVLKSATLSTDIACPAFSELHLMATPILRVAVEPENPAHLTQLTRGLKLLNQADTGVRVLLQETGEHVLITTGEVHLQRCVEDLRERYAKVPILVSEPIIPFRETIVSPPKTDMVNEMIEQQSTVTMSQHHHHHHDHENQTLPNNDETTVTVTAAKGLSKIRIKAIPLPTNVVQLLEENADLIKFLIAFASKETTTMTTGDNTMTKSRFTESTNAHEDEDGECYSRFQNLDDQILKTVRQFRRKLSQRLKESDIEEELRDANAVWSFGPKSNGLNILFNAISKDNDDTETQAQSRMTFWESSRGGGENVSAKFESNLISGFQMCCSAGPLCEEPMMGVGFVVSHWSISSFGGELSSSNVGAAAATAVTASAGAATASSTSTHRSFSGQLVYAVKEGCRKAFQMQPQRLMAAMYTCNILANTEVLGRMYALLNKRHGRIVHGDLATAGSGAAFNVTAFLPVADSFLFASEVRKQTSGLANPQLVFSHWEIVDMDPFWSPYTEEEYLLYGEKADSENYARTYMNNVRKRKGLPTDEKVVEHAEKQRTLSKNK